MIQSNGKYPFYNYPTGYGHGPLSGSSLPYNPYTLRGGTRRVERTGRRMGGGG